MRRPLRWPSFVHRASIRALTYAAAFATWYEAQAVLQHASASKAGLIVMGAQGTGGLELMTYGSNTQHVVRAATCPVLTGHA